MSLTGAVPSPDLKIEVEKSPRKQSFTARAESLRERRKCLRALCVR
jgi:hypothetical protein